MQFLSRDFIYVRLLGCATFQFSFFFPRSSAGTHLLRVVLQLNIFALQVYLIYADTSSSWSLLGHLEATATTAATNTSSANSTCSTAWKLLCFNTFSLASGRANKWSAATAAAGGSPRDCNTGGGTWRELQPEQNQASILLKWKKTKWRFFFFSSFRELHTIKCKIHSVTRL